jgi:hypothetical protein
MKILLYDELPDLAKIPGKDILNYVLKGSRDTIALLDNYISKNNVKIEAYSPRHRSINNYYILEDKIYYLSLEQ